MVCCSTCDHQFSLLGTLQVGHIRYIWQFLEGYSHDATSPDVQQLQQEGTVTMTRDDEQKVSINAVSQSLGMSQQGVRLGGANEPPHTQESG